MLRFQLLLDVWSHGVEEHIRCRNAELVEAAYLNVPPARFWLYLKRLRSQLPGMKDDKPPTSDLLHKLAAGEEPEDCIARSTLYDIIHFDCPWLHDTHSILAWQDIQSPILNRLMRLTAGTHMKLSMFSEQSIWEIPAHTSFESLHAMVIKILRDCPSRFVLSVLPDRTSINVDRENWNMWWVLRK